MNFGDPGWLVTYVDLADRVVAGSHPQIADVSPVYLGLMVALRFLGASIAFIRSLHLLMLVAGAAFCALAAKRLGGWVAAVAAAVLILGNRAAWVVCSELDPKALIFLLTSAALWALLRGSNVTAGILLGLAAATHPYGYVLLLIALLWSAEAIASAFVFARSRTEAPEYESGGHPSALHIRGVAFLALGALVPIIIVLTLSPVENHSSAQFYEGNNVLATGCAGVTPRVVTALQTRRRDASPDPAYRLIAGNDKTLWRDKALASIRELPAAATKRFATKALLTIHHFDVHDVITAQRRNVYLSRFPAIGFGVAFVLAVAALLLGKNRRELLLPALFAVAMIVLLTVFVVSARQRNVLLAPLAILGGVGVTEIVALTRRRVEHGLLAFGALLIAAALLGIETTPMREYDHMWRTALRRPVDSASPATLFDRAIDLERAGRWLQADAVLALLGDYRPQRQSAAVSSVAYYRARAALALGRPAEAHIERAALEAPGDPNVLGLRAAIAMDHAAARLLDELHDPLTRDRALRHGFETLR
jgi:hypothetical protein